MQKTMPKTKAGTGHAAGGGPRPKKTKKEWISSPNSTDDACSLMQKYLGAGGELKETTLTQWLTALEVRVGDLERNRPGGSSHDPPPPPPKLGG